jgi:hypothetical protein
MFFCMAGVALLVTLSYEKTIGALLFALRKRDIFMPIFTLKILNKFNFAN